MDIYSIITGVYKHLFRDVPTREQYKHITKVPVY
jgi:hypothetical protein